MGQLSDTLEATTMLEKVAQALCQSAGDTPYAWPEYLKDARAAIEAMREPTEAMLDAEHPRRIDGANSLDQHTARAVWESMIDAALEGKPE